MAYISLDSIIREMLDDNGDTLHLYNKYLKHGINAVKELSYDIMGKIYSVLLEVDDNLMVYFPDDYVDYTKIGVLGADGNIKVLGMNNNMMPAYYNDACGNLKGTAAMGETRKQDGPHGFYFQNYIDRGTVIGARFGYGGGYNPHGHYRVNKAMQRIELSLEVEESHIVLEYITNGVVKGAQTMVNEISKPAIRAYIIWKLNWTRRDASLAEREMYKKDFYTEKKLLNIREHAFTAEEFKAAYRRSYHQSVKN